MFLHSAHKKRPADEPPGDRSKFCPGSSQHDLEKACPALDAGWSPAFSKDHAQLEDELEKAEHDGSDEGEREIGGDNAEPAGERTDQAHGGTPLVHVVPLIMIKVSKAFPAEKVSAAVHPRHSHTGRNPATWFDVVKEA
jgi:hypothetical protein